ncbi:hypothetical protein ABI59_08090 [Acidobacteria bacterium Mor1]|nr:hypothetical protein ABI59_08090 [Acidobacteria bacterium Mor1]
MNAESRPTLLFVYNADSGVFNSMADIAHKIFSPETYECALCNLTHGYFRERAGWKEFVEDLPAASEFLHRDEFRKRHPERKDRLPVVLLRNTGAELEILIDADTLDSIEDAADLKHLLRDRLEPGR